MNDFPLRLWQTIWYSLIFVMGGIGNYVVITVILKCKSVQRSAPFNVYLLSLAGVDLLIATVCLPIYIMSTSAYSHPGGLAGKVMCKLWTGYFVPFWLGVVDIYILTAICLERRRAVVHPFSQLHKQRLRWSVLIIVLIACLALLVQCPTIIGISYGARNATIGNFCVYEYSRTVSLGVYAAVFTTEYVVAAITFIISFGQIRRHVSRIDSGLKSSSGGTAENELLLGVHSQQFVKPMKQRRKAVNTMKLVVAVFFVCVTPNEVMYILFQLSEIKAMPWNSPVYQVGVMLRFSHAFINPILYSFRSAEFRKHLCEVYPRMGALCCCADKSTPAAPSQRVTGNSGKEEIL